VRDGLGMSEEITCDPHITTKNAGHAILNSDTLEE
jgi:hypothetical protein